MGTAPCHFGKKGSQFFIKSLYPKIHPPLPHANVSSLFALFTVHRCSVSPLHWALSIHLCFGASAPL